MSDTLARAKACLILDQPFFASLLLGMELKKDASIPTAGTDGKGIRYNPAWLNAMPVSEVTFVLAHEVMHCVFEHMYRRGTKDKMKYNIAADFVINDLLVKDKVGSMPKGGLHSPALVAKGGGTTEGVYDLLPDSDKDKQAGQPGGPMDLVEDASGDTAEQAKAEAEMRVKVIQAANAAKMCGALSKNVERLVKDITATKTDWRAVLRRFFTERAKVDWSFAKPKRRFMAEDLCLPSLVGEQLGEVVFAVDCSGSITEELLNRFGTEVKAVVQDTNPSKVHILYFDSEVVKHVTFEKGSEVTLKACGGGGTAFSPIWKFVEKLNVLPAACVVLTDLECSDFGKCPDYPVLWASIGYGNAPFGEIVTIKD